MNIYQETLNEIVLMMIEYRLEHLKSGNFNEYPDNRRVAQEYAKLKNQLFRSRFDLENWWEHFVLAEKTKYEKDENLGADIFLYGAWFYCQGIVRIMGLKPKAETEVFERLLSVINLFYSEHIIRIDEAREKIDSIKSWILEKAREDSENAQRSFANAVNSETPNWLCVSGPMTERWRFTSFTDERGRTRYKIEALP